MQRIERLAPGFRVHTSAGILNARCVLLAIGRRGTPRKLGVPGEEQAKVVYRVVDPEQYRGQRVLVVGGGDSAVEAALACAAFAKVSLAYRGEAMNRIKRANRERLAQATASGRLDLLLRTEVREIGAREVLLERAGTPLRLANDSVVVCAGGELPTEMLREIGVRVETRRGSV